MARAGKVGLAKLHYGFLVGNYFELLCQTHLIPLLYQEQNFQAALLEWVGQDIHRLVWIIWQINDTGIAN